MRRVDSCHCLQEKSDSSATDNKLEVYRSVLTTVRTDLFALVDGIRNFSEEHWKQDK